MSCRTGLAQTGIREQRRPRCAITCGPHHDVGLRSLNRTSRPLPPTSGARRRPRARTCATATLAAMQFTSVRLLGRRLESPEQVASAPVAGSPLCRHPRQRDPRSARWLRAIGAGKRPGTRWSAILPPQQERLLRTIGDHRVELAVGESTLDSHDSRPGQSCQERQGTTVFTLLHEILFASAGRILLFSVVYAHLVDHSSLRKKSRQVYLMMHH